MLIRLENSGREFEAADLEFVLDAAERVGADLPYSCRDGICGTCKHGLTAMTRSSSATLSIGLPETDEDAEDEDRRFA